MNVWVESPSRSLDVWVSVVIMCSCYWWWLICIVCSNYNGIIIKGAMLLEWWVLNALYFLDECDFPWVHVLSWCERLWKTVTSDLCVCCFLIYLWGLSLTVAARAERRAVLTLEVSTIWKVTLLKSYSEFKLYFHLINFHWYWQNIVIFPWI